MRDVADVTIGSCASPRHGRQVGGCPIDLNTAPWIDRLFESRKERDERERLDNPLAQRACDPNTVADEPDIVQGIVLMRYGAETKPTLKGLYKRMEYIRKNHILPPGMDIEPYYDRNKLVDVTTHTVMENLLVGMGLVMIVLLLFLGNVRAAIITAINIPIALLIAFSAWSRREWQPI